MKLSTTPRGDGYFMPAEFSPHDGCLMIWPERPGSWPFGAQAARRAFAAVASAIGESEQVYMLASPQGMASAKAMLPDSVRLLPLTTDDAWARDVGPTFVVDGKGGCRGVDWAFNAWGGTYDGLYPHWDRDDKAAAAFCQALDVGCYDAHPFVLEGGSIHVDGEGTLLTTEACLLSPGRNPKLSREEIETRLSQYLGIEKVLWLPHGIWGDETNEHVDNVCAFTSPGEVVLAWTDDPADPQYAYSQACYQYLSQVTDARGRQIRIHKLPIPKVPVCITAEELAGFDFEPGEDMREPGERLAASYVNFYIANGAVVLPQFGDVHDALAVETLARLFPSRKIVPIPAQDILVGGGNIHCITQQIPKGGISHA